MRDPLQPGDTWWARFTSWEATASADTSFARTILTNINSHSSTHARGVQQLQIRRQQQALAQQLQPSQPHAHICPTSAGPSADLTQNAFSDEDDFDLEDDLDAAPAEQAYVASLLDEGPLEAPTPTSNNALSAYISTSTQLLADASFTAAPASHATVRLPLSLKEGNSMLQRARKAAADFFPTQAITPSTNTGSNQPSLHVTQHGNAWRLDVLAPQTPPSSPQPDTPSSVAPPPFLRAAKQPSMRETARLFGLSPDQARPFVHAAQTLQNEITGTPQPPLRMIIVGRPGTGASCMFVCVCVHACAYASCVCKCICVHCLLQKPSSKQYCLKTPFTPKNTLRTHT